MAELTEEEKRAKAELEKIKNEKKKLAAEQKKQKAEAKKKAKELAAQEEEWESDSNGSMFSVVLVTILLVVIWAGIFCLIVKLDIGGLGSNVMAPILKDIPVIKYILPKNSITESEDLESYYGYSSLEDAVNQIKTMEKQLEELTNLKSTNAEQIAALSDEVKRLKTFEDNQVEFQRIKTDFYEQVVYSDKGPGPEAFIEYFEGMDPETAEYIYRQVIVEEEVSKEVQDYATAYSEMKPKQAAGIFEAMTDNLALAAKILGAMTSEERGKILGVMDPEVAAKITKLMEPTS